MIKKKLLDILKTAGVLTSFLVMPSLIFALFNLNDNTISNEKYIIFYTISNAILSIILIYIYRNDLKEKFKLYIKDFGKNFENSFKYWIIGLIIMFISNLIILFLFNKQIAGNEDRVRTLLNVMPILMIINSVIFAPINEELVFRKSFKDILPSKYTFILVSGFVFGFLHIVGYITSMSDFIYLIPYSSLGIVFALLYHKSDNIFNTIAIHSIHNLIAVIITLIGVNL